MIEQLYLDLAEETNDQKFYGKLFQACKAVNELHETHSKTPFSWLRNIGIKG